MTAYIIRRIAQAVILLFILSFVIYYILSLMPGDPVDILASSNPHITTEDISRLKTLYGLDKPAYYRYWNWFKAICQGDFGYSRTYLVPTLELIGPRLWNSFLLSLSALIVSLLIGISIGVYVSLKPNSKFDYTANLLAFLGISTPSFWLGIVLIILFGVIFPFLPAGGTYTLGANLSGIDWLMDRAKHLILPICSLSIIQIGTYVRFTRSSMLETLRFDFIRTARAKGMSKNVVIWRHGFRNALIPIITIVALNMAYLFSGTLLTETVFGYQGIGRLIYSSIMANDFNVAMISFTIAIIMVFTMSLIADLLYAWADPRISYK